MVGISFFLFFFYNQRFITWRAIADRGSYFRNYIQEMHTNMKLREKKERKRKIEEEKEKELIDKQK